MEIVSSSVKGEAIPLDSYFIGLINSLNESIKEFYKVSKYNTKQTNDYLNLFPPELNSISNLINLFPRQNSAENISKINENIIQCNHIVNQLRNNLNLNFNNLSFFFDDAKLLFKQMREKKRQSSERQNSSNRGNQSVYNHTKKNFSNNVKNFDKNNYKKIISLILQLKDYNEIVGKFSIRAKNNFINLQKMILNMLTNGDNNSNLETETNNNNSQISNKAKKYDELKQKFEQELMKGNNDKNNNFESGMLNLINTSKNLKSETERLKAEIKSLNLSNIQLKKKLLEKEEEDILSGVNKNNNNKKNEANTININSLNIKIEKLSKLLTMKTKEIIVLEKENLNLKTLLTDNTLNSYNSYTKTNLLNNNNNIIRNDNINISEYVKLMRENKKNKSSNNYSKTYLKKINQEIMELKKLIQDKNESQNNDNINLNKYMEEINNKDKIISELKNKIINNNEQILLLNNTIKNNKNNINELNRQILELKNKENNKNLEINQMKQKLLSLKKLNLQTQKEKDKIQQAYNKLKSQNSSIDNIKIKKKDEEIEGLNIFIQKLTKENEKNREDLEAYQKKIILLQKENISTKNQLERLSLEMPKELNALKSQLDEANKKLSQLNNPSKNSKNKDNIIFQLNQEILNLQNKNKELISKLEEKEKKSQISQYKTEDDNMSDVEEEFDLKKMALGAKEKNRSQDINIDYPGIQNYKEKLSECNTLLNELKQQVKILLAKIKINNNIKPIFVQICQLLGYSSNVIEKMATSEKEKKKVLGM